MLKKVESLIIPLLLFVFNVIYKIIFISHGDICMDEPFTIFYAQGSIKDIYAMLFNENNPPLFFVLTKAMVKMGGIEPFIVRFLPMLFSSLTSIIIYKIGQRNFHFSVGLFAALFFTFSNLNILHAHDARAYSLLVLLCSCSIYSLLNFSIDSKKQHLYGFTLYNIFIAYTHFMGYFIYVAQIAYILFHGRKNIKEYIISYGVLGISFIPYAIIFIKRFSGAVSNGTWIEVSKWDALYFNLVEFTNQPVVTTLFLTSIMVCCVLLFIQKSVVWKNKESLTLRAVFYWFGLFFFVFFISLKIIPLFIGRYVLFIAPSLYLITAVLLYKSINKKLLYYIASSVLVVLMITTSNPKASYNREPKELAKVVKENCNNSCLIIIHPPWYNLTFAYHYDPAIFSNYENFNQLLIQENIYSVYGAEGLNGVDINTFAKAIVIDGLELNPQIHNKISESFTMNKVIFQDKGHRVYEFFNE